jgi:hypothetical protein
MVLLLIYAYIISELNPVSEIGVTALEEALKDNQRSQKLNLG